MILAKGKEHFWQLFPVSAFGTTHTLVEVVHSSNREHRHGLKSDSAPGYYGYMWPITIPNVGETIDDFDELYSYSSDINWRCLLLGGKTFKHKDFSLAIEKSLLLINELMEISATE